MQYLALNGFRHSLSRYFNSRVNCVDKFNWTERNAISFASYIDQPTTLIGFSDGATAALTIACHSPFITTIYCHSPMSPRSLSIVGSPTVYLFRTKGDSTPTFLHTQHVFHKLGAAQVPSTMATLDPGPHEPIRDFATLVMRRKNHQFRNCLRYLPSNLLA